MSMIIREYTRDDAEEAAVIRNHIMEEGIASPQADCLTKESAGAFFSEQSLMGAAFDGHSGAMVGLHILRPNNVGRCDHICDTSYTAGWDTRGRQIGKKLACHCMEKGKELSFDVLQFNAVVKTNEAALHLYQRLGFTRLGVIPGGFLMKDGRYEDIIPHYTVLQQTVISSPYSQPPSRPSSRRGP